MAHQPPTPDNEALRQLTAEGVALWLDGLSRRALRSDGLERLVREAGVSGAVADPAALADAVSAGAVYQDQLGHLAGRGLHTEAAVHALAAYDARSACDLLLPVFTASGGLSGRVSIDVDPRLSHDTTATVAGARALVREVNRPNVLVRIPATEAGLDAISACLAEGIGVNAGLIFSVQRYAEVVDAYFDGLERALPAGRQPATVASVASLSIAPLDTEVDARLDKLDDRAAGGLRGEAAIANARLAYELYEDRLGSDRWRALAAAGARPQRLLWAATDVADPTYPDTRYVDELIAWGTVNAVSRSTLDAVADHGKLCGDTLTGEQDAARGVLNGLERLGISYDSVVRKLHTEDLEERRASWETLLEAVDDALRTARRA